MYVYIYIYVSLYIQIYIYIYNYIYIHLRSTTWFVRGHACEKPPIPQLFAGGRGPKGGGAEGAAGGREVPVLRWFMGENHGKNGKNMGKSWGKYGKIIQKMELLMGKSSRNGGHFKFQEPNLEVPTTCKGLYPANMALYCTVAPF